MIFKLSTLSSSKSTKQWRARLLLNFLQEKNARLDESFSGSDSENSLDAVQASKPTRFLSQVSQRICKNFRVRSSFKKERFLARPVPEIEGKAQMVARATNAISGQWASVWGSALAS